jgi:stage V sporulation protein S
MGLLKVSSRSNPNAVAGAFAGVVREQGFVEVQVVGAGALNQAIKAVAIARSMLGVEEVDLVCIPAFAEIEIDGEPRTAMQLVVERRDRSQAPKTVPDETVEAISDLRVETSADGLTVESTQATQLPAAGDVLDRSGAVVAPVPPSPAL